MSLVKIRGAFKMSMRIGVDEVARASGEDCYEALLLTMPHIKPFVFSNPGNFDAAEAHFGESWEAIHTLFSLYLELTDVQRRQNFLTQTIDGMMETDVELVRRMLSIAMIRVNGQDWLGTL
jgi:hypothetical protein